MEMANSTVYPILYSFRRCPYAIRARLALLVSDRLCELREISLSDKPQEMLDVSPKGTVPVLIDTNGLVLDESIDIMLWALKQHDPEKWLMPENGSLETMLELIDQFDHGFKYHLDRYKYSNRYPDVDAQTHRTEGFIYLARLNEQLRKTTYLFGDRIALADLAIAPFVRQFAHTDQSWFNQQSVPYLQTWLTGLVNSEIYTLVMKKYPLWESGNTGVFFPILELVISLNFIFS